MNDRVQRIAKLSLRVSVTITLLWVVIRRVDTARLGQTLATADFLYVFWGWGCVVLAYWVRSMRMRFILKRQDCSLETSKLFGISCVTALWSFVLPGFLSVGVKWYLLKKYTGQATRVLSAMVYNQVTEIAFRLCVALLALTLSNPFGRAWVLPACVLGIAVLAVFLSSLLYDRISRALIETSNSVFQRLPSKIRDGIHTTVESGRVFRASGWRFHVGVMANNLVAILLSVMVYWSYARAISVSVPLSAFVWQGVVVVMLSKVPLSLANFGVREYALTGFLALYGVDPTTALCFSLLVGSNVFVIAGLGALFAAKSAIRKPGSASSLEI